MFAEEGGKKYTYTYCDEGLKKIAHPQEYLPLSTPSPIPPNSKANHYIGEHYEKLWRAAENLSHLCELNRKFLLGGIPETPYHGGPIDPETIPLVESLLKLHDFQLVTESSQPYEHSAFKLREEWAERQQRPFVSFIMPREHGRSFFEMLKKRPELVV
jgi:hypothetical protein